MTCAGKSLVSSPHFPTLGNQYIISRALPKEQYTMSIDGNIYNTKRLALKPYCNIEMNRVPVTYTESS